MSVSLVLVLIPLVLFLVHLSTNPFVVSLSTNPLVLRNMDTSTATSTAAVDSLHELSVGQLVNTVHGTGRVLHAQGKGVLVELETGRRVITSTATSTAAVDSTATSTATSTVPPAADVDESSCYSVLWTGADGNTYKSAGYGTAAVALSAGRFLSSSYEGMEPAAGSWMSVLCAEYPVWTVPAVDDEDESSFLM